MAYALPVTYIAQQASDLFEHIFGSVQLAQMRLGGIGVPVVELVTYQMLLAACQLGEGGVQGLQILR